MPNAQYNILPTAVACVQGYEEKINLAVLMLESNADIMTSLSNFYSNLRVAGEDFSAEVNPANKLVIRRFCSQLDGFIYDTKMQIAHAKALAKVTAARKNMVRDKNVADGRCAYRRFLGPAATPSCLGSKAGKSGGQHVGASRTQSVRGSCDACHHRHYFDLSASNFRFGRTNAPLMFSQIMLTRLARPFSPQTWSNTKTIKVTLWKQPPCWLCGDGFKSPLP